MYRCTIFTLTTMALLGLAVTLPAGDAAAQQKQKVSYQTTAANTKYTQQHAIEVEDVPGHILRVYEIHRTYPNNPPTINGVALKEQFTRGTSDQTDNNGVSINVSNKPRRDVALPWVGLSVLVPLVLAIDAIVATIVWYVVGSLLR